MEKLIAMRENLGLGHKGNILITTQERIDKNEPPIMNNIIGENYAKKIIHRWNNHNVLLDELETILKVEFDLLLGLAKLEGKPQIESIEFRMSEIRAVISNAKM